MFGAAAFVAEEIDEQGGKETANKKKIEQFGLMGREKNWYYSNLFKGLEIEDPIAFKNFTRMST